MRLWASTFPSLEIPETIVDVTSTLSSSSSSSVDDSDSEDDQPPGPSPEPAPANSKAVIDSRDAVGWFSVAASLRGGN
ncbi:unnamed protein product [Phytophthora fragariaefolia]|uniref:Unnamed protein product n=1 Tax=Phytophthora fragariaefolia TaxID=1490495 RepID=A0A9W7DBG1_9STRA|nr:unnamed protein product [Phytophthora fragariaefolia]